MEQDVLDLLKHTNYNDTMWPFIAAPAQRHIELRIDDAVYVDLCALAPSGDAETMLRAYFARHARNVALWVDGNILIFDKDDGERAAVNGVDRDHIIPSRSYIRIAPSFYRMIRVVFALSIAFLTVGALAFLVRLFVDSEIVDALLVMSIFAFLANATAGIASVLLGCHRLHRDEIAIAALPSIHYIDIL